MKVLIVRFSSFGDVLQALSVAGRFGESWPEAEVHWITRAEFVPLIERHPNISRVWSLNKGSGLLGLIKLGIQLRREGYSHVYDAHNNLRSNILGWLLLSLKTHFLKRSIYRWRRFLLFKFRYNLFPKPFSGQFALLEPLQRWGLSSDAPPVPQLFLPKEISRRIEQVLPVGGFIALAPSAAFELKRWPMQYWKDLIASFPDWKFVVLGGPEDGFLSGLEKEGQVFNLAGKLSLLESAQVIARAQALVANDTGLMHVAEQIGKPCIALMGPAPFGFPSRKATTILELNLDCRPCSKHGQGPCFNKEFHKCLRGILPGEVALALRGMISASMA